MWAADLDRSRDGISPRKTESVGESLVQLLWRGRDSGVVGVPNIPLELLGVPNISLPLSLSVDLSVFKMAMSTGLLFSMLNL